MSLSIHGLVSKFKQKLNISDLCRPSEKSFEIAARALPDIFQALREYKPDADREWRNQFSKILEVVASQHTRESQAAECRKLILDNLEVFELARTAVEEESEPEVLRLFFKDGSADAMSDHALRRYAAEIMVTRLLDSVGLDLVYAEHFDNTLPLDSFREVYSGICKVLAWCTMSDHKYEFLVSLENKKPEGWDSFHLDVVCPAFDELIAIKRDLYQNLVLLSPKTPDLKRFLAFKNGTLKQIKGWDSKF